MIEEVRTKNKLVSRNFEAQVSSFVATSKIWSTPTYSGTSRSYFLAMDGERKLICIASATWFWAKSLGQSTYRPPIKCRPLKYLIRGFGAVRLTRAVGMNELPSPDFGGPSSIFHDDGASTEVTGSFVVSRDLITPGNGSLTSPEKLNPINSLASDVTATYGRKEKK